MTEPPPPASPETAQGWVMLTGAAYHAAFGQKLVDELCEPHRATFDEMTKSLKLISQE